MENSQPLQGSKNIEHFIPKLPSEDWELNILLDDIANEITNEELKRLKLYCIGEKGTGKGTLSEMKDASDLFTHLRHTLRLTRDNTIVLQAMLFHLRRRDLQRKVVDYGKRLGNVLHFYAPSDIPENGYEYIKVHVVGTESFDRDKLDKLRDCVARLLCIPPGFVVVKGIEAANSILVTFMVPIDYASFVLEMDAESAASLISEGVDLLQYDGKTIDLKHLNQTPSRCKVIEMNKEMQSLASRNKQLEADVEKYQIQLIQIEREKNLYKVNYLKLNQMVSSNSYLANMIQSLFFYYIWVTINKLNKPIERLSTKAAYVYFRKMLVETETLRYDPELIRGLLEANTQVITAKIQKEFVLQLAYKETEVNDLASRLAFLQYEKEKLAYYLNIGEKAPILSQREEFWLLQLSNPFVPRVLPMTATVTIPTEELAKIFIDMSKKLTKKDRTKLTHDCTDQEKKKIVGNPHSILQFVWEKEVQRTNGQLSLGQWIEDVTTKLSRTDLKQRFHEMVQSFMRKKPEEKSKPKMTSKSPEPRRSHEKGQRRRRNTVSSEFRGKMKTDEDQSSSGFGEMEMESESSLTEFQILNSRMHKIESVLDKLVSLKSPQSYPFQNAPKGTDNPFSSISSFIPKHN